MTEPQALFDNPQTAIQDDSPGTIVAAANRTIDALRSAGALDETHELKLELIRVASRALDREFRRDRITVAATTLFGRTLDTADSLPTFSEAQNDVFEKLVAALNAAD